MSMFCFQCEQTAKGTGCTIGGVCGKKADTANLQDELTAELIALARATNCAEPSESTHKAVIDGLFTAITNVNFDNDAIDRQIEIIREEKVRLSMEAGGCEPESFEMSALWGG